MKKRALSILLCFVLFLSVSGLALAADATEGSTTVTKTVEAPPSPSPGDEGDGSLPSNSSTYEVSIPAAFSMDGGDYFAITASKIEVGEKQAVMVWIDYDRTFSADGYFRLVNTQNVAVSMPCLISRGYPSIDYWEPVTSPDTAVVAVFNKQSGTTADQYGTVKVEAASTPAVSGVYSGTIYFTIELVDF